MSGSSADKQKGVAKLTDLGPLVVVAAYHRNTDQNVITLTEDKIKLCLIAYQERLHSRESWQTPAAIFLSVALSMSTSTFHQTLNVSPDVLHAFFLIVVLLSFCWLVKEWRGRSKCMNLEDVIAELKNAPRETTDAVLPKNIWEKALSFGRRPSD